MSNESEALEKIVIAIEHLAEATTELASAVGNGTTTAVRSPDLPGHTVCDVRYGRWTQAFVGDEEIKGTARLTLNFLTAKAMVEWFDAARKVGVMRSDTTLYLPDARDKKLSLDNVFTVKRIGDRAEKFRLTMINTKPV